jgi:hypothetical protein
MAALEVLTSQKVKIEAKSKLTDAGQPFQVGKRGE